VLGTSCSGFFVSNNSIVSVTVSPAAVLLKAGNTPADTYTLSSTAVTAGGTSESDTSTAKWTSSATTVVTAASGGVLTAAGTTGNQTATITATDSGQSGTCSILTYTGSAPTTLTLQYPNTIVPGSLALGSQFQVSAFATFNNVSTNISNYVTWTLTSNTTGSTISSTGVVTVPSSATAGTFTVNAQAAFGSVAPQASVNSTLTFTVI
jgi:hypothetical protein